MWLILLILYTFLILASGAYGSVFVAHSHWDYVVWVPPLSEIRTVEFWLDILVNIALYLPFGMLFLQRKDSADFSNRTILLLLALILSCTVELYQVYSHNRRPSPVDIVCNVSGAMVGTFLWNMWKNRLRLSTGPKAPPIPIR